MITAQVDKNRNTYNFDKIQPEKITKEKKRWQKSPQPGIEPGSKPPEGLMLPLHHWGQPKSWTLDLIYCMVITTFENLWN